MNGRTNIEGGLKSPLGTKGAGKFMGIHSWKSSGVSNKQAKKKKGVLTNRGAIIGSSDRGITLKRRAPLGLQTTKKIGPIGEVIGEREGDERKMKKVDAGIPGMKTWGGAHWSPLYNTIMNEKRIEKAFEQSWGSPGPSRRKGSGNIGFGKNHFHSGGKKYGGVL